MVGHGRMEMMDMEFPEQIKEAYLPRLTLVYAHQDLSLWVGGSASADVPDVLYDHDVQAPM